MATVLNIPLTTLAVGAHTFGPTSAAGFQTLDLLINRTVGSFSLNSQPATTTVDAEVDVSTDGGASWHLAFSGHAVGGTYVNDETGQTFTTTEITQSLPSVLPPGAQARAVVTVGGSQVSVSGSMTLS